MVVAVGDGVAGLQPGDAVFAPEPHAELMLVQAPGPDVIAETSQSWSGLLDAMCVAREKTRIAIVGIIRTEPTGEVAREVLRRTFMDRDRFHNQHVRFIGCYAPCALG